MPKETPSMAKNKIRRSLLAIIDPHPSRAEIDLLWSYFQSSCAYCGIQIQRESRTGHLDHVVSSASGGGNCIFNYVLSCGRCNGDEKREESWEAFLARKVGSSALLTQRHARIFSWLDHGSGSSIPPGLRDKVDGIIARVIDSFENAVRAVRALRERTSFAPRIDSCLPQQTETIMTAPKTKGRGTTVPGYRNRNGQVVVRGTSLPGNDHLQKVYVLRCEKCQTEYGSNGSDIFQRRCPACDGGRPGLFFGPSTG